MRVGLLILPTDRWAVARHQWRWAEAVGFGAAWTYDHLVWGGMPDGPWHAAYPLLAAAAGVTERVRLGTLVTNPNFRHPVTLAREVITLDDLSGGRFDLGLGVGSDGHDAAVLGRSPWSRAERTARLADFVALLDRLLTEPVTDAAGRYYTAVRAVTTPGCLQRPRVPFTLAATGPRGMALVARFARHWVTYGDPAVGFQNTPGVLAAVRQQSERLLEACQAAGRPPAEVGRIVLWSPLEPFASPQEFDDVAGHLGQLGVDQVVVHHPAQTGPYGGSLDVYAEIAGRHAGG